MILHIILPYNFLIRTIVDIIFQILDIKKIRNLFERNMEYFNLCVISYESFMSHSYVQLRNYVL